MADDLNSLLQANRTSSVLEGIANPPQFNPLAAQNSAVQAAHNMLTFQKLKSEEAAGQAFLDSIKDGRSDQAALLNNLKADPRSAFSAQTSAQAGQTLDTGTYDLHNKRLGAMHSAMGQLIADNPNGVPFAEVQAAIQRQLQLGTITPEMAKQALSTFTDNPRQNTQTLLQGITRNLAAQTALDAAKPPQVNQDVGGRIIALQPTPQLSTTQAPALRPGAGVTTGPPPGQMVKTGRYVSDGEKWVWQEGETPASTVVPPGGRPVPAPPSGPVPAAGTVAPAGPAPTPPAPGTRLPTGYQPRPGAAPAAPAPVAPGSGGGVGGKVAPDRRSEISGGVQVAGDVVPATGFGSSPSPAVAGDVAAIMTGMDNARAAPGGGTQTAQAFPPAGTVRDPSSGPFIPTAPPMGTKETLDNNRKVADDAALAMTPLRDNHVATVTAIQALRLSNMASGPTSSWKAKAMALLEANALSPGDPTKMSETDWRQVAQKNLLRLAEGKAAGRTDMGLETQLQANPNMDSMLANANEHVLIQDLGRLRQRIVQNMTIPRSGGNAAINHVKNYGAETDYRGFAWDMMSKAERDKILKEVEKDPKAKARLFKAIEDADEHQLFIAPDEPKKSSVVLPPRPMVNALSLAG